MNHSNLQTLAVQSTVPLDYGVQERGERPERFGAPPTDPKSFFATLRVDLQNSRLQPNSGRIQESERSLYRQQLLSKPAGMQWLLYRSRRSVDRWSVRLRRRGGIETTASADPREHFKPSAGFADLVLRRQVRRDQEPGEGVEFRGERITGSREREQPDIAERIGDRIEGLLANLARRAAATTERSLVLSDGRRLAPDFCEELMFRLGLDPFDARPVFERLYRELMAFAMTVPRQRGWGRMVADESGLKLEVDHDKASAIPDLDKMDPEQWTVTR